MVAPDREKLRAAFRRGGERTSTELPGALPVETGDELRALLQRRLQERRAKLSPVELPPGEVAQNAHGVYWRRQLRYPLAHRHGAMALGRALLLDGDRLAVLAKDPAFATLDPRQCLFFDTETTGLSGGAGTVVFNVGLGWFEDGFFVLEQLFLRDFGEEPAMLMAVAERLQQRPVLVSYVGKSFDRHRIAARLAVHRLQAPILTAQHLDLYYAARRAFGKQLPDCKLRTVEEQRLSLHRADDLPGSEAPVAFLQWLRDRTGQIDRVLEHNRLDVLSVAALLGLIAGREG